MKIGKLTFLKPVALAPMENISDMSYRLMCRQMGADIVYTEFTSCEAIIRDIPKQISKLKIDRKKESPVGIQLFGSREDSMAEAAGIVSEKYKPDFIDINCGCWTKRHALKNEGAGLLLDVPLLARLVKATVKATKLPVTVKTRLGWDLKQIVILDVAKRVEQAGAQALTVHCRTRSQGYKGIADWSWLEKIRKVISIPLIGNGGIVTHQDAQAVFETGCDGIMVGRAAIGNPWIFQEIKHFLKSGKSWPTPPLAVRKKICLKHLALSIKYRGLRDGLIPFRKFYAGYFHGMPGASKLRSRLMQLDDYDLIKQEIRNFQL